MSATNSPGREALRRKRLRVSGNPQVTDDTATIEGLVEMSSRGKDVALTYDVCAVSLDTLVDQLRTQGSEITNDFRSRLFIAWQSYLDRNARAHLTKPGSPCCSNSTSIYASRKKR